MDFAWLMVGLLAFGAIFPDIFHPFPDPNLNADDKDTGLGDPQIAGAEAHAQTDDTQSGPDTADALAGDELDATGEDEMQPDAPDMAADAPVVLEDEASMTLEAEAESEAVWVSEDAQTGLDAAQVDDFQPGEDVLFLTVDAGSFPADSEVDIVPSDDGNDGLIYVNNELIAVLKGVPQANAADIVMQFSGMLAAG